MPKGRYLVLLITLLCFNLFSIPAALGAEALPTMISTTNAPDNDGFTLWQGTGTYEGVSADKKWTIKFNQAIDKAAINSDNIFVLQGIGGLSSNKVNVTLTPGSDGKSLTVNPPAGGYQAGQTYTMYLRNIKSPNGFNMTKYTKMKFTIAAGDSGTPSVIPTQQKVAKIAITSTQLAIAPNSKGYASYKVYDQNNNDITSSSLAKNISFASGVGTIAVKSGTIELTPNNGVMLVAFPTVVISAADSTSGTSASATLTVSTAIGTLADIKLNKLVNAENKAITAGDTASVFYIDYTATDLSGNPTKDYVLVKNGLILSGGNQDELITSHAYLWARVIPDPGDNTKAAIEVKVVDPSGISKDLPLTITAKTYFGTSSYLNTTFKKTNAPDSVTLMMPAYEIAIGEVKEIPFEIRDKNGALKTKFVDIAVGADRVELNGAAWYENIDGTARLLVMAQMVDGPQVITATTQTGKTSTLTLNIVKHAEADNLTIAPTALVTATQAGATQWLDNGYFYGGVSVKDQYGRAVDMKTKSTQPNFDGTPGNTLGNDYEVYVFSSNPDIVSVKGSGAEDVVDEPKIATGRHMVEIKSLKEGNAYINFYLLPKGHNYNYSNGVPFTKEAAAAASISTKSVSISVIKNDDIAGYSLDAVAAPIYAGAVVADGISTREASYAVMPKLLGRTNNGTKVLLANPGQGTSFRVMDVYTDSPDFLAVKAEAANAHIFTDLLDRNTKFGDYNAIMVVGKKLDPGKSEVSANITVSFTGVDNKIYSLTTPVKSSSASPVAKAITLATNTEWTGQTLNSQQDTMTVYRQDITNRYLPGMAMGRAAGDGNPAARGRGFHFRVNDSYGSIWVPMAQFSVTDIKNETTGQSLPTTDFELNADGTIKTNKLLNMNDTASVKVTAKTNNGLSKTVKFVFVGNAVQM